MIPRDQIAAVLEAMAQPDADLVDVAAACLELAQESDQVIHRIRPEDPAPDLSQLTTTIEPLGGHMTADLDVQRVIDEEMGITGGEVSPPDLTVLQPVVFVPMEGGAWLPWRDSMVLSFEQLVMNETLPPKTRPLKISVSDSEQGSQEVHAILFAGEDMPADRYLRWDTRNGFRQPALKIKPEDLPV